MNTHEALVTDVLQRARVVCTPSLTPLHCSLLLPTLLSFIQHRASFPPTSWCVCACVCLWGGGCPLRLFKWLSNTKRQVQKRLHTIAMAHMFNQQCLPPPTFSLPLLVLFEHFLSLSSLSLSFHPYKQKASVGVSTLIHHPCSLHSHDENLRGRHVVTVCCPFLCSLVCD